MRVDREKLRHWQRDSALRYRAKRTRAAVDQHLWRRKVREAAGQSAGMCQADGMHAVACQGIGVLSWHVGQGHHVHPRSWGGTDESSAVMWVHPDCHANIHNHPADATERGYLTRGRD